VESARPAAPGDVPAVAALATAMLEELTPTRGGAIWAVREAPEEPFAARLGALLARPDAVLAVGTLDGGVVGFGAASIEVLRNGLRLGRIDALYVEQEARGVGVGEALARLLVDHCARAGCTGVDALVLPGNRGAKNFLETHGFTARAIVAHRTLGPPGEEAP
jgi:ribosomal protein S18 acetylase RimI-like enzyme